MLSYLMGILLYQLILIGIVSVFTFAFMEKNKENYLKIGLLTIVFFGLFYNAYSARSYRFSKFRTAVGK